MAPEPPSALPAVLRLQPHRVVLPLGPGARLLGLDPASATAVDGIPPVLAEMLDELDDPVERAGLVERATVRGADRAQAEALLRELVEAGVLVDAAGQERTAGQRAASTVLVTGDGPLAVGVVIGLHQAGVGTVHVETAGSVLARDLGTGYLDADRGHLRSTATAAAVRRLCPDADPTPAPARAAPDLVVLADVLAPEPAQVARLLAAGIAHLPVRLRDGVGLVGPLVLPGRTACLGCIEIHRCALDEGWPTVAAQLAGRRGRADPACTAATAALATAQAVAALDGTAGTGSAPPTLDATLELDPAAGTLVRRVWAPSPGCRCGAGRADGGARHGCGTSAGHRDGETIMG